MHVEQFWELVRKSKRGAADCNAHAEQLVTRLQKLEPHEIVTFDQHLRQRLADAYRWDLWAVAYIINGGCSDDGFEYFRCWLVAQGKDFFEAVLHNPEHAARRAREGEAECEAILYAPAAAYESKMGQALPDTNIEQPDEPAGTPWQEDELERLYPKLWKRFIDNA
jgi:hypothetical protein